MFLRHMFGLYPTGSYNYAPHVPIIMSDFEDNSNPTTSEQEEIEALMAEGLGPSPSSSCQALIDNLPVPDIPDLPLSNPLRETLESNFSLW